MFDDVDKSGIVALLAKLVRVQDQRRDAKTALDKAIAHHAALDAQWIAMRGAFVAYGFDATDEKLWEKVKAAMGKDLWDEAFALARPGVHGPKEKTTADETSPPSLEEDGDDSNDAPVRKIVLRQLRLAGNDGLTARKIRDHFKVVLGRNLHEKTVGMTLYRLSRDGLARREGRTWFAVPETANPGGETPGSIESAA